MDEANINNKTGYRTHLHFDLHAPKTYTNDERARMRHYYTALKEIKDGYGKTNPRRTQFDEELTRLRKWLRDYNA